MSGHYLDDPLDVDPVGVLPVVPGMGVFAARFSIAEELQVTPVDEAEETAVKVPPSEGTESLDA